MSTRWPGWPTLIREIDPKHLRTVCTIGRLAEAQAVWSDGVPTLQVSKRSWAKKCGVVSASVNQAIQILIDAGYWEDLGADGRGVHTYRLAEAAFTAPKRIGIRAHKRRLAAEAKEKAQAKAAGRSNAETPAVIPAVPSDSPAEAKRPPSRNSDRNIRVPVQHRLPFD